MAASLRAEAPSVPISIRFSPAEVVRLDHAAAINLVTRAQFVRDAVGSALEDCGLEALRAPESVSRRRAYVMGPRRPGPTSARR